MYVKECMVFKEAVSFNHFGVKGIKVVSKQTWQVNKLKY